MIPSSEVNEPTVEDTKEVHAESTLVQDNIREIFCMDMIIHEQNKYNHLMAYKAVANPDVMYMHQAMK